MSREGAETCASCARFPLRDAVNNGGRALCAGYDVEKAWNHPATVLHLRATDRRERQMLVDQLEKLTSKEQPT